MRPAACRAAVRHASRLDAGADGHGSCLVLLGGWMAAAASSRGAQYVENLRDSIHQHRVDAERATAPVIERAPPT